MTVTGDINNTDPAGIIIKGQVNLYFEARDFQTQGPTLTVNGAKSSSDKGAGAGIELLTGSTLYVCGRGYLNVTGGNVD